MIVRVMLLWVGCNYVCFKKRVPVRMTPRLTIGRDAI
jgi:hypothetical protein